MEIIKLGKTKEQLNVEMEEWKEKYRQEVYNEIKNNVECGKCHSLLKVFEEDLMYNGTYTFRCINCSNLQLLTGIGSHSEC